MTSQGRSLNLRLRSWVWCRLFWLQASWNYETLQGLGIAFAVQPAVFYLYPGREGREVLNQYLPYFNTHPYMAPSVVGVALKLEQDRAAGEPAGLTPRQFSEMVMAPYAAVGDALFWGGLRPMAAVLSLYLALLGSLWAPVVFVVLFAVPHLWMGFWGYLSGFRHGILSVETVQRWKLSDRAIWCKKVTMLALGGVTAWLAQRGMEPGNDNQLWVPWALAGLVPLVVLLRRGVPPTVMVFGSMTIWALVRWAPILL